jgi:copper chaperone CopZ
MMKTMLMVLSVLLTFGSVANANEPQAKEDRDATIVKADYVITGLHCPPCTKTVESSLKHAKGIRSIQVDWKSKNAHVEFDESIVPAQKLARLIADTPHMMGGKMHYGGLLVLKVNEIKDKATAKPVQEALGKVKGVERVLAYPAQHSVEVQFATKGDVTTKQLIDALKKAGLSATI